MSKENPQPGDVFMVRGLYPILVIQLSNVLHGIFFHNAENIPFTAAGGGKSAQEIIDDPKVQYIFSFDAVGLEQLIKEKYKNGEFKHGT